jgi:hypothetical protein
VVDGRRAFTEALAVAGIEEEIVGDVVRARHQR